MTRNGLGGLGQIGNSDEVSQIGLLPAVIGAVGQHADGIPVNGQATLLRLDDDSLAGFVTEDIVGGQGLALDGLVHQGDPRQLFHRLTYTSAPAEQPGQQAARMDGCSARPGAFLIDRILREMEQGPHQPGGVYPVHQNGLPKAQHRHAGITVSAGDGPLPVKSGGAGHPLGHADDPVGR